MNEILFEVESNVAIITFNRPEVLNVFRRSMFQSLLEILDTVARDDSIRVLLLTGAGRAFSAGIDLEEVSHLFDGSMSLEQARVELDEMQELTRCMLKLPKPIISAINGIAIGVGAEVAIASDIRLASEPAFFSFAEVQRGLFETNGVMYLLPRLVGRGRAAHLMLTAEKLSANSASEIGLVSKVYPSEALIDEALKLAHSMADHAPIPMRLVKQVLHQSYEQDFESVLQLETQGMLDCLNSTDLREGVQAFLEKRKPVFMGK
ncbi:MAG: enoyl-CoA hydratase-related protein [Chloroflexota bacterium]